MSKKSAPPKTVKHNFELGGSACIACPPKLGLSRVNESDSRELEEPVFTTQIEEIALYDVSLKVIDVITSKGGGCMGNTYGKFGYCKGTELIGRKPKWTRKNLRPILYSTQKKMFVDKETGEAVTKADVVMLRNLPVDGGKRRCEAVAIYEF